MKKVTLAELAAIAKHDKALEQKIIETAKSIGDGYRETLTAMAAEFGYELTLEATFGDPAALSDDELEAVSGGVKSRKTKKNPFCEGIMDVFEYDKKLCY